MVNTKSMEKSSCRGFSLVNFLSYNIFLIYHISPGTEFTRSGSTRWMKFKIFLNIILVINKTSTLGTSNPVQLSKMNLKHNNSSLIIYSTCNEHWTCVLFKIKVKYLCKLYKRTNLKYYDSLLTLQKKETRVKRLWQ